MDVLKADSSFGGVALHLHYFKDPGPFSFLPAISVPSSKTTAPGIYALPFISLPFAGPEP
ncbi:hypothetical protein BYT27DRAFT_7202037 [Phlegmacium glaucopus]|nr:hypothetical protein BYT27DRAFT_7202037 [Phlegmacium glaucopus]